MSPASRLAVALAAGTAALALASQAASAGTVVAASGPSAGSYPVGTQVSDTQRISLRSGDVITVLDGGRTRVLRGPGTFVLAERGAAGSDNRVLAGLTSRRGSQARIASSRGVLGGETGNPNLWYVDVAASGTVCLLNVDSVNLWRADKTGAASYSIAPADAPDAGVRVTFDADEGLARWDSAMQIRDGGTYVINSEPASDPVEITFTVLSDVPEGDPEALAQALISNGCTLQLEQIIQAAQSEG